MINKIQTSIPSTMMSNIGMANLKKLPNKMPKIIQDLSGNLEAKYSLRAQLGVTQENSATNYQVSPVLKDEPILIKVIASFIFTFISSQIFQTIACHGTTVMQC